MREAPGGRGVSLPAVDHFASISDMSFFGQAAARNFGRLSRDTSAWGRCVKLHEGSLAQVPTVNPGPWECDFPTPLERIETDDGFRVLPRLLGELCRRTLKD